jgi:hypothetical protein
MARMLPNIILSLPPMRSTGICAEAVLLLIITTAFILFYFNLNGERVFELSSVLNRNRGNKINDQY